MNYLTIANKMCRAIGYAEMPSIALANPDQQLVLEWVADAWVRIQELRTRWSFMEFPATVNILTDKNTYTPTEMGIPTIKEIVVGRTILLDTSDVFVRDMVWITPEEMEYYVTREPKTGEPEYYSTEDGITTLYPTPDQAYKMKLRYMVNPVVLTNDTDEPACPEQFHKIILFDALREYAVSDNSPEQFQFGDDEFYRYLNRMDRQCHPQPSMNGRHTGDYYNQKHSVRYPSSAIQQNS